MPGSGRRSRFRRCAPLRGAFGNNARPLQMQLHPGVAPAEAVILDQMLVEMLGRETRVALAVKPLHLLRPSRPEPACPTPCRAVDRRPGFAVFLVTRRQRRNVRSLTPSNSAASSWFSSADSQRCIIFKNIATRTP